MIFWLGTGALLVAALAFVLAPAWGQARQTKSWPITSLLAAALLVPFAIGLYLNVSTWSDEEGQLPAVDEMVAGLAERLEENPDDVEGWQLLGQSYLAMGAYGDARRAFREAWARTPAPDDQLRLALGEAEALTDPQSLAGEAGELFSAVLANDPNNQKALFFGGAAAAASQQPELARERWSRLLAFNPPENIAQILRQQLQALGGVVETPDIPQVDNADAIRLLISVDETLEDVIPDAATLFIFARSAGGGPPVAAKRVPSPALPGEFSLSGADAPMRGGSVSFSDFETLSIVARLSLSGQAIEQAGDLFGEISYSPGQDLTVQELIIDQISQ